MLASLFVSHVLFASSPAPQPTTPCPLTPEIQAVFGPAAPTGSVPLPLDLFSSPTDAAPLPALEIDDLQCGGICITTVDQPCPSVCTTSVFIYECNTGPGAPDGQPASDGRARVTSECIDGFRYRVTPTATETWGTVDDCDDIAVFPVDC